MAHRAAIDDGVQFEFQNEAPNIHLKHDLAVTLFQAVRELLVNVVKHAKATQASVRMVRIGSRLSSKFKTMAWASTRPVN